MPALVFVLVAIVGYRTGWIWPLMLCFVVGLAPWFAAAKVLDDNVKLRRELHRRDREDTPPADFTERMVDAAQNRARLRIVEQRTGEHEDAGREWPRLAREIETETPIRDGLVVEEFMDAVEAWGEDVER
jgi:hypothetical protein